MCISPNFVWVSCGPKWEQQPVACRQCWRCKNNRLNDYVARAMCEASVSTASCTVSLTYAPREDYADKVLHPRHFQLFIKLLRRSGHKVRYLVAGEYGDAKGRAHFHALLFFTHVEPLGERGPVPAYNPGHIADLSASGPFCREIPHKRMVHIREWPHGHISADWSSSEASARYVCKYLLSDDKNNAWFSLSKKPPLGAAWFAHKAAKAREAGVLPSSFEYLPPGGRKDRPYLMTGATRRDYLNAISTDPDRRSVMSEWVLKTFDKQARARWKAVLDTLPVEVVQYATERLYERRAEIEAMLKRQKAAFVHDVLNDLISQSADGTLVKYGGHWLPPHEAENRRISDEKKRAFEVAAVRDRSAEPGFYPEYYSGEDA